MTKEGDKRTEQEESTIIATQEQESKVAEEKHDKVLNIEIVAWNVLLYLLSTFVIFLFVQHAIFFYYPVDFSRWVYDPLYMYFEMGLAVFLLFKFYLYVAEQGKIFPDEPPADQLADEDREDD